MGIRDTAMTSRNEEPESYGNFGYPGYSKSIKQQNLFGANEAKKCLPNIYPKGIITVEIAIPITDLAHADPEDPNYDYFKAMSESEDVAIERIEALAGKDVKQRYRIDVTSQDGFDEIIVTVVLTPRKNK